MRQHIVRGAAIAAALALLAAGCSSSSSKVDKTPQTVFPTTHVPTTSPGSATTGPGTTAAGAPTTTSLGRGPTTTLAPGVTTGPTTPVTTTTVPETPSTFVGGIVQRWKFNFDFGNHPGPNGSQTFSHTNPFGNYQGGPLVWSLREGATNARVGLYALLPTFASTFGADGLVAWHDNGAGCPKLPAIGVNLAGLPTQQCSASIPGNAAFLEPSSTHPAIVAWTSPFDGVADISHDAIADADGTCGDGVSYFVDLGTKQLSAVRLTNNNSATLPDMRTPVVKGQSLYFIVDSGPANDSSCDATQLAITVDELLK
jgi:hypothetical protein